MLKTSHSQLTAAITCPWLYYVNTRFRDKITVKSQSQLVGTIVHTVAERFYAECPYLDDKRKMNQLGWLHAVKDGEFVKEFGQKALDAIREYQDEYSEAVEATIEFGKDIGKNYKAPTWTGYWQREYAARFDALEQEVFTPIMRGLRHVRFQSTLLDIYQHISRCTDNFLGLHRSKIRQYAHVYVEYKLDPRLDIHGALKGGRIDLIGQTADGDFEVWDFKTGRKDWDQTSVYNEPQLNWYVYGTEQQFGSLPVLNGDYGSVQRQGNRCPGCGRRHHSLQEAVKGVNTVRTAVRQGDYRGGALRRH